jgi:RimJ/RimL family protein N-acetyltransferase
MVQLRKYRYPDDVQAVWAVTSDPSSCEYDDWNVCSFEQTDSEVRSLSCKPALVYGQWHEVAVCTDDGSVVGFGSYLLSGSKARAEIGLHLCSQYRGKGLAVDAIRELSEWMIRSGASAVNAVVSKRNARAMRAFVSAGFSTLECSYQHHGDEITLQWAPIASGR